uniref:CD209 antigen-like protein C n=1 Tax=Xiphophorus maculatus TaxID=8083 RepID=A0A3B5Q720_XIPMA
MARAVNRNAAEIDYVNQPHPSTNGRPELETGGNDAESGIKSLRVVAVIFGVLCILQVALNVSLRLALNVPQPTPDEVFCGNETQDMCKLKQETRQYLQKGWLYFRDSFYYMSSIKKTWDESRKYCLREDADLLIINSREEQNFITQLSRDRLTWIGLHELSGTERWIWVDGAPLTERFLLFLNIKKNLKNYLETSINGVYHHFLPRTCTIMQQLLNLKPHVFNLLAVKNLLTVNVMKSDHF